MNAPDSPGTVLYRLDSMQKAIDTERADRRRDVDKLDVEKADTKDLVGLGHRVDGLAESVDSLRKAIVSFAFVVAGSAIVFAFTVLQLLGQ